jgi:hypothetical protein
MDFKKTGLLDAPIVQKAYERSWSYHVRKFKNVEKQELRSLEDQIAAQRLKVENAPNLSDADKQRAFDSLEAQEKRIRAQLPLQILRARDNDFSGKVIAPAKAVQNSSINGKEEIVTAMLLLNSVRSPRDFQTVQKDFPPAVTGLISEYVHYLSYPSEADTARKELSENAKFMVLADMVASLDEMRRINKTLQPQGKALQLQGGTVQIQKWFETAKDVRGIDKKLDDAFISLFNGLNKETGWGFSINVSESGALSLVEPEKKTNQAPATQKKKRIQFGDNDDTPPSKNPKAKKKGIGFGDK